MGKGTVEVGRVGVAIALDVVICAVEVGGVVDLVESKLSLSSATSSFKPAVIMCKCGNRRTSNTDTDIIILPKETASGTNGRIPRVELLECNAVFGGYRFAFITIDDIMPFVAYSR